MRTMRAVIDTRLRTPVTTGVGRYLEGLVPALANMEPETEFILLTLPGNAFLWEGLPANVIIKEISVPVASVIQHIRLGRIISELSADLFHYPMFDLPYGVRVPTIITVYDLNAVLHSDYFTKQKLLRRPAAWFLHSWGIRRADRVITMAEFTRQDIIKHFHTRSDKISVILSGYQSTFHTEAIPSEEEIRARWKLEGPYLLYVGVHRPHKNLEALIHAFAGLSGKGVAKTLVIAGSLNDRFPGPAREAQAAGVEDHVRFTGFVEAPYLEALYKHAALFVFPSFREGFGFPLVEAMDMGTPIACSDIPVHREIAGDAAKFFNPEDQSDMVRVINDLLADDEAQKCLIEAGRRRLAFFNWERAAAMTLEVYREVLKEKSR